jgi:photosystem II stability/assembly factor-like uncharacterized protein
MHTYVRALAVVGSNLFAGTNVGVFRSTDNGESWTAVSSGWADIEVMDLAVIGENLAALTGGGAFLSMDNGNSWTATAPISTVPSASIMSFAVMGTDLFAGTMEAGVFRLAEDSQDWTAVNTGLIYPIVRDLAVIGTNLFVSIDEDGVYRSTDNGRSWIPVISPFSPEPHYSVSAFAVRGENLFISTLGTVFVSANNGMNWIELGAGLPADWNILRFTVSGTDLFAVTYDGDVWRLPLSDASIRR